MCYLFTFIGVVTIGLLGHFKFITGDTVVISFVGIFAIAIFIAWLEYK
jgi:hypothetical protein